MGMAATLVSPSSGEVRYGERTARSLRSGAASPDRPARARAAPLSRTDGATEPGVLRRSCTASTPARPWRRRSRPPACPTAATTTCRDSRAGCDSALRSSARCFIGRGWSCSTSRSPASTTVRSGSSPIGCGGIAAEGAIVLLATHDLDLADGLVTASSLRSRDGTACIARRSRARARAAAPRYRALVGGRMTVVSASCS